MKITIRIDDVAPGINWENFERFKSILDAHDIKPLIGVVPDNKDQKLKLGSSKSDFWQYIKSLQDDGWTIAMHGLNHLYTTKAGGIFPLNKKSEFAGLDLDSQILKIRQGKEILEKHGIFTDIFMAPSHSYDLNTLNALKMSGFTKITDGFGNTPYLRDGITFYPISMQKSKSLASEKDGITTFVYHPNTMDKADFESFEKVFDKADIVSYSEFVGAGSRKRTYVGNISEWLLAKMKYWTVTLITLIKQR